MIAYLYSLSKQKTYKTIDQFFLTREHTFLPNDWDFACIENYKKKTTPMVPNDYVDIIQDSRTIQPFEVIQVKGSEIKDYKVFWEKILEPSLTAVGGETLKIRQVMWFLYGSSQEIDFASDVVSVNHEDEMWCRYTLNDFEPWKKVYLCKRKVSQSVC